MSRIKLTGMKSKWFRYRSAQLESERSGVMDGIYKVSAMFDSYMESRRDGPKPVTKMRWGRVIGAVLLVTLVPSLAIWAFGLKTCGIALGVLATIGLVAYYRNTGHISWGRKQ